MGDLFFFLQRSDGAVLAFQTPDGLTVPFYSAAALAKKALASVGGSDHGVGVISPTQLQPFSDACKRAGAKFLQMDPLTLDPQREHLILQT